ncbi:MAG: DUF438 domain-containing protein [bacterium]
MQIRSEEAKLKEILERLNAGEDVDKVKEEAKELLENISPEKLSQVEQKLIEGGIPETELRHLCAAHIEMMADELENLKTEVEPGHPLHTLISEHDEILEMLEQLEEVNNKIKNMKDYNADDDVFEKLQDIAHHLIETEKHHQREEDAIFPEVYKKGVTGPTRIMRMEHDDLWPGKERLEQLAHNAGEMDFSKFKQELKENAEYLVLTLRDHIFKENNILYPTAKEVIEENKWDSIKEKCNEIGYCCFTPEG